MTPVAPTSERSPYHVLLIGIDRYTSGPPLGGCVNDIDAIQKLLRERLGVPVARIKRFAAPLDMTIPRPTEVETHEPLRANLIAAFKALAAQDGHDPVRPGDRVFIYYSGHGAQRFATGSDGVRYWREALVPTDNLTEDDAERLFFDWELCALLSAITACTTSVTAVFDCCNSAGATRGLQEPGTTARCLPPPKGGAADIRAPADVASVAAAGPRGLAAGAAACMVVAACLDNEVARESGVAAARQGELTRALVEQLNMLPAGTELSELRWGQIWRSVAAGVERQNPDQHPWLSDNPMRRVFGGPPESGDVGYRITFDGATSTYSIDAGELMDVTKGAKVGVYDPIGVAASPSFSPLDSAEDLAARRGILEVISAEDSTSTARLLSPAGLSISPGSRGRLISAGEDALLAVELATEDPIIAEALASSSLVRRAKPGEKPRMTLVRRNDGMWAMTDDTYRSGENAGEPTLSLLTPAYAAEAPFVKRSLEHYYRWTAPLRLAQRCMEQPRHLTIRLMDGGSLKNLTQDQFQDPPVSELHAEQRPHYQLRAGVYDPKQERLLSTGEAFCVRLENSGPENLWVTLFACLGEGTVSIHGNRLFVGKHSRTTAYLYGQLGAPFEPVLFPPQVLGVDRLVAIGTTNKEATLDHLVVQESFTNLRGTREPATRSPRGAPERWMSDTLVLHLQTQG